MSAPDYRPSPWPDPRQYPPPYRPQRTEPLAIAALACSFFVSLLGVVFGHIALSRIRRTGDGGRGLAIGGLVVGYASMGIAVVMILALVLFGGLTASVQAGALPPSSPLMQLPDRGPSPANMNANGGITLGVGGQVASTAASQVDVGSLPSPDPLAPGQQSPHPPGIGPAAKGQPVQVVVYMDFMCPACADFHASYGPVLDRLRNEGKITVEYRPVTFLDRQSSNRFSSRAADAAACVANAHPGNYSAFLYQLYAHQPPQGSAGLSDQQLKSLVAAAGADASTCIDNGTYLAWARYTNRLAIDSGINAVPTAFVDGRQWGGGTSTGLDFIQFVQADLTSRDGSGA